MVKLFVNLKSFSSILEIYKNFKKLKKKQDNFGNPMHSQFVRIQSNRAWSNPIKVYKFQFNPIPSMDWTVDRGLNWIRKLGWTTMYIIFYVTHYLF